VHGVVPLEVQDPALALGELYQVPFQPIQVSLNGSMAFQCTSYSSQFGVISRLAEGTLCPCIQVIDE